MSSFSTLLDSAWSAALELLRSFAVAPVAPERPRTGLILAALLLGAALGRALQRDRRPATPHPHREPQMVITRLRGRLS